jgi:cobalamin biosynthetic protein CobC
MVDGVGDFGLLAMKCAELQPPQHGGDPSELADKNGAQDMLDLATGINPWPWPFQSPPATCYTRLPYDCPVLQASAAAYYGVSPEHTLATAGSQAAIQTIPALVPPGRVLLPLHGYEEHRYRWQQAGHELVFFENYRSEFIAALIVEKKIRHLVLISPNNPSGVKISARDIRYWRSLLPTDGLLLVDQAFADAELDCDLRDLVGLPGLVILRSVGKFFGLPGLRLGFVLAPHEILSPLKDKLGPWPVSGSAQWLGMLALDDRSWQLDMRLRLQQASLRQAKILTEFLSSYIDRLMITPLFISMVMPPDRAKQLQRLCYAVGLSVRVYAYTDIAYMRWGLAGDEDELLRRLQSLAKLQIGYVEKGD